MNSTEQLTCEEHSLELAHQAQLEQMTGHCGAEQLTCEKHSLELTHQAQLEQMTIE